MDLFVTLAVVIGLSFGTVLAAMVGISLVCMAFGAPYDANAPVKKAAAPEPAAESLFDEAGHRRPNYVGIFATLLVLTVVTVALSRINLGGAGNTALAMAVASFKASLVALYFMHLKDEKRLLYSLILIPMFFFAALFFGLLPDLVTNNYNTDKNERPGFGVGVDTVK